MLIQGLKKTLVPLVLAVAAAAASIYVATQAGAAGNKSKLKAHKWKHRILVVGGSSESLVADQNKLFVEAADGAKERKLLRFALDELSPNDQKLVGLESAPLTIALIGLDGSVKKTYEALTPMKDIFEVIDGMPMRQREQN